MTDPTLERSGERLSPVPAPPPRADTKGGTPLYLNIGDPVVVDGTKYRIRAFRPGERPTTVELRTSFGGDTAAAAIADLTWDHTAGVWRVAPAGGR